MKYSQKPINKVENRVDDHLQKKPNFKEKKIVFPKLY